MSTYNNVLGDFTSFPDDLSDADDGTDESGSEPEPELGSRSRFNVVSHDNEIDDRSRFVQAVQGDRRDSTVSRISVSSSLGRSTAIYSRSMSANKEAEVPRQHLIVGDFELANVIDCEQHVLCCKYSPRGEVLAVGLSNGTVKVYTKAGQCQYVLTDNDTKTRRYPVTSLTFYGNKDDTKVDHQAMLAATYTAGYVKVWHYPSQQCVWTFDEKDRQPLALDFNSTYTRLLVAGSDCAINCYDFTTKKLVRQLKASGSQDKMDGHKNRIHAVRSHPTMESIFLTGGWDETVHYWDERAPYSQKHFSGPYICGDALDIIAEHQVIITGSWRKSSTLQIWDFSTGDLIKDAFHNHATSMLYCTKFSSKDHVLCAGNEKNEAMIYDYSQLKVLGGITDLEAGVYCADTEANRLNMIVGSGKHIFIVNDKSRAR